MDSACTLDEARRWGGTRAAGGCYAELLASPLPDALPTPLQQQIEADIRRAEEALVGSPAKAPRAGARREAVLASSAPQHLVSPQQLVLPPPPQQQHSPAVGQLQQAQEHHTPPPPRRGSRLGAVAVPGDGEGARPSPRAPRGTADLLALLEGAPEGQPFEIDTRLLYSPQPSVQGSGSTPSGASLRSSRAGARESGGGYYEPRPCAAAAAAGSLPPGSWAAADRARAGTPLAGSAHDRDVFSPAACGDAAEGSGSRSMSPWGVHQLSRLGGLESPASTSELSYRLEGLARPGAPQCSSGAQQATRQPELNQRGAGARVREFSTCSGVRLTLRASFRACLPACLQSCCRVRARGRGWTSWPSHAQPTGSSGRSNAPLGSSRSWQSAPLRRAWGAPPRTLLACM